MPAILAEPVGPASNSHSFGKPFFGQLWEEIRLPAVSLVVEERSLTAATVREAQTLLAQPPFCRRGDGPVLHALAMLGQLPPSLAADIARLGTRFSALMGRDEIRLRLEHLASNACTKVHADYTDVRLITTYCGPGTQIPLGDDPQTKELWNMPGGHVGLFKGRLFEAGHTPCFHRSPPAGDTGDRRLVLVIDTPVFDGNGEPRL